MKASDGIEWDVENANKNVKPKSTVSLRVALSPRTMADVETIDALTPKVL